MRFLLLLLATTTGCSAASTQTADEQLARVEANDKAADRESTYGPGLELGLAQGAYAAPLFASIGVAGESGTAAVALGILGGSAVGGLTGYFGRNLHFGQVQVINSVVPWVAWHAGMLATADTSGFELAAIGVGVLGYLGAPGLAFALARLDPHSGTVALANSAGLWTAVGILLAREGFWPSSTSTFSTRPKFEPFTVVGILLAGDLAIVAGALLGRELRPSRAQVFALDGLAILGVTVGALVGRVASDDSAIPSVAQGGAIGLGVGLAAGLLLLPRWDLPLPERVHVSMVPAKEGHWLVQIGSVF